MEKGSFLDHLVLGDELEVLGFGGSGREPDIEMFAPELDAAFVRIVDEIAVEEGRLFHIVGPDGNLGSDNTGWIDVEAGDGVVDRSLLVGWPVPLSLSWKDPCLAISGPVLDQFLSESDVSSVVQLRPSNRVAEQEEEFVSMTDTSPVTSPTEVAVLRLVGVVVPVDIVRSRPLGEHLSEEVSWTSEHKVTNGSRSCQSESSLIRVSDVAHIIVDSCLSNSWMPDTLSDALSCVVPSQSPWTSPFEPGDVGAVDEEDIGSFLFTQSVHEVEIAIEVALEKRERSWFRVQVITIVRSIAEVRVSLADTEDLGSRDSPHTRYPAVAACITAKITCQLLRLLYVALSWWIHERAP